MLSSCLVAQRTTCIYLELLLFNKQNVRTIESTSVHEILVSLSLKSSKTLGVNMDPARRVCIDGAAIEWTEWARATAFFNGC